MQVNGQMITGIQVNEQEVIGIMLNGDILS